MIQKFRDFMEAGKNIEEAGSKLDSVASDLLSLRKEIEELKSAVSEMGKVIRETSKTQRMMLDGFKKNVDEISEVKTAFKEEMFNFNLLKNQMHKQIMDKFAEELQKEIEQRKEELNIDAGNYKSAKDAIEGFAGQLKSARDEIKKLTDISGKLKAGDFELVKFAKGMKDLENEKIELLRKIDTLERLVGKMRRSS